jgi:hypothetical protein
MLRLSIFLAGVLLSEATAFSQTDRANWCAALAQMPLADSVCDLNRSNCVDVLLHSFRSNEIVRALVFMPGATDELYMFKRARAFVTNTHPTMFDAVVALTNQTLIRATFQTPLLLMHSDEDPLSPEIQVLEPRTVEKLKARHWVAHALLNDRDWETVQPLLKKNLAIEVRPWRFSDASWHFYRHSFAGWNLSGWEAMNAVALAGKSKISVRRAEIDFEPDLRIRAIPQVQGTNFLN